MCALNISKKSEIVSSYQAALKNAKVVILSEYSGNSVTKFEEVRRKVREADAKIFVVKNTLFKRALEGSKYASLGENVAGPLALIVSDKDMVGTAKAIAPFFSNEAYKFNFRAAMSDESDAPLSSAHIQMLSKIPSRDELYARMLGSMQAPIRNVMSVLQAVPRNLASVLSQVSKKSE